MSVTRGEVTNGFASKIVAHYLFLLSTRLCRCLTFEYRGLSIISSRLRAAFSFFFRPNTSRSFCTYRTFFSMRSRSARYARFRIRLPTPLLASALTRSNFFSASPLVLNRSNCRSRSTFLRFSSRYKRSLACYCRGPSFLNSRKESSLSLLADSSA